MIRQKFAPERRFRFGVAGIAHCLCIALVGASLCPVNSIAQTTDASLVGDVLDPQHLPVVGATVRVTSTATSVSKATITDDHGSYRFFPLQPGTYQVEVKEAGFTAAVTSNVAVDVAANVKVDFTLQVGSPTEQVTVSGGTPLLQTQDAAVGTTITSEDLARLPVNGRNYTRLILLSAGSSDRGNAQNQGTFSGTNLFSINGQRQQDNNYTLDGIDNNFLFQNSPGLSPPMDAIQEFRVLNDTSAEFGRSAGANVNLAIKSGTRKLNGTLYEYLRNDVLDSNDFFNKQNGVARLPFRQNQFGATIGGPVLLPHLYNGRDRTFFFANYEGFRELQGLLQLSNTPTAAERTGDLSALGKALFNPFSSSANGVRQQFPGGVIPAGLVSPNAVAILNDLQPLPNQTGIVNNLINTTPSTNNRNLWDVRLDHALTAADTLTFRYSFQNLTYVSPYTNTYQSSIANFDVRNFVVGWVHSFSPRLLLEAKMGYNNADIPIHDVNIHVTRAQLLQDGGLQLFQQSVQNNALPIFTVTGEFTYTSGTGGGGQVTEDYIYEPLANLSYALGRHSLKTGAMLMIRDFHQNTANPMNGTLTFSATQTAQNSVTGGDSLASFLLGVPSSFTTATGSTETQGRGPYQAYYVQDNWRASSKLTADLGLRYEYATPPYAESNEIGTLTIAPNSSGGGYTSNLYWAGNNSITGQGPQRGGFGRSLQASKYLNFAPRIGIAYEFGSRSVIRGGYGIFYNSTFFQELQDKRKFYPYVPQLSNSPNLTGVPTFLITSPSPAITGNIGGDPQDTDKATPSSQQWNVYIERQLGNSMSADIGYFGSVNRHQIGYTPINQGVPGPGPLASRRPIAAYGDLYGGLNIFPSNYNSLRVDFTQRYSHGFQFLLNYTYGKTLGENSSLGELTTQNQYDRAADYGRTSYDVRNAFQAAYVYDLPFGRGRLLGANWMPLVNGALGGWGLEGITRLESGSPMNVLIGSDIAGVGGSAERPNRVGDPNSGGGRNRVLHKQPWFNTSAFATPVAGTFGNAGQNITEGDGRQSWDLAVQKSWRILESQSLNFRAEAFNLPNHVNFNNPTSANLNLTSSSFGVVTSATSARQIQFALRYNY